VRRYAYIKLPSKPSHKDKTRAKRRKPPPQVTYR